MSIPSLTLNYSQTVKSAKLMLVSVSMLFCMAAFARCNTGCQDTVTPDQVLERNYTTDIIACAATAGFPGAYDEAADKACRAKVNCRYGVGPCP